MKNARKKEEQNQNRCAICYESDGDLIQLNCCNEYFDTECIREVYSIDKDKNKFECPYCRQESLINLQGFYFKWDT